MPATRRADPFRSTAGLVALAFAVLLSACSTEDSSAAQIGISPEAFTRIVEGDEDFLQRAGEERIGAWIGYVDGDRVVRLRNGGVVPVGDLEIEFHIDPFPPTQFDTTVELLVLGPGGEPAEVQISAWYDMVFMTHGQPTADVEPLGDGRYRMPLDLFMFGPWVLKATITSAATNTEVPLVIYVWPNA